LHPIHLPVDEFYPIGGTPAILLTEQAMQCANIQEHGYYNAILALNKSLKFIKGQLGKPMDETIHTSILTEIPPRRRGVQIFAFSYQPIQDID
jgi:hypothetical protein